ncbi:hypothetical protein ACFL1L_05650 [Thermoplasmatota archaeon]
MGLVVYTFIKIMMNLPIYHNENYVDWWYASQHANLFLMQLVGLLMAFGTLILLLSDGLSTDTSVADITLSMVGTIFIGMGGYLAGGYSAYIYFANSQFTWLLSWETDIHLRFIDNSTKKGIDNLDKDPNYIRALNEDAIQACINIGGGQGRNPDREQGTFVYELGLDEYLYINETGEYENGWYSLNMRSIGFDSKYRKPPCPPGHWTITMFANQYETHEPIQLYLNSSETKIIKDIILFPEK